METQKYSSNKIAVVIPFYNSSNEILLVISKLPDYIHSVIIVDDQSPTPLPKADIEKL
ncbi:MAG: hypothetical protein RIM68_11515 [Arenibacter sp.]